MGDRRLGELEFCEETAESDTFGSTTGDPGCGEVGTTTADPTAGSGNDEYGDEHGEDTGGEGGEGDDAGEDDGEDEGNISESSTSGSGGIDPDLFNCSVGGSSGGALAVLGLGLLGLARRRRRSAD